MICAQHFLQLNRISKLCLFPFSFHAGLSFLTLFFFSRSSASLSIFPWMAKRRLRLEASKLFTLLFGPSSDQNVVSGTFTALENL